MNLLTKAPANASQLHICFTPASSHSNPRLIGKIFLQTILLVAASILAPTLAHASSATWDLNPTSGDWNTAANWTPMTVPSGPADIATFGLSNTTDVSISANTEVNGITFAPGNSGYTITVNANLTLTVSGGGIIGSAGFVIDWDLGTIVFSNSATAGSNTFATTQCCNGGMIFEDTSTAESAFIDTFNGGGTWFLNRSTAGNATIYQNFGGIAFFDGSTAGNATISMGLDAGVQFLGSSTAGNATIYTGDYTTDLIFSNTSSAGSATIIGAAPIYFSDSSNADSASVESHGQFIFFEGSSRGGTAQIEIDYDPYSQTSGVLDISYHNAPGVTIGSIEGDANTFVSLGANNLTVGSNGLSTTFSGVIEDNGFNGSLTKIGKGTLDLKGANTYTGLTNINGGVLQIDGSISSNTFINHKATLAGGGTVYGNVTNYGGEVSPGGPLGVPGALTVSNNYMQTPSAALVIQIAGGDLGQVSVLDVQGNANLNGSLDPELMNGFVPTIGQSFNFLGYASATGSFSHIKNPVFDHGTKRWSLVYGPSSAYLVVVSNGRGHLSEVLGNYRR